MTMVRTYQLAPDDYLHDIYVNAADAAGILGFSGPRFRQIAGTREQPDALLGAPYLEKGVRGGRWPLRRVLEYGLHHRRPMQAAIPPLLPRPNGGARYRAYGRPIQVGVVAGNGARVEVWVQLFESSRHGEEETLLVLTPVWPTEEFPLRDSLGAVFAEFVRSAGLPAYLKRPPAVLLPVVERGEHAWGVLVIDSSELEQAYYVPFEDAAQCLGWDAVPVWMAGTNSASALALWAPGRPAPVTIPVEWGARWAAAQYSLQMAARVSDPELAGSYRGTWKTMLDMMHVDYGKPEGPLPERAEWAAQLTLPERSTERYSWYAAAVDEVIGDPSRPAYVADALLSYFGDWRYSGPHTIDLSLMPGAWSDRFAAARRAGVTVPGDQLHSARLRRLQGEAIANADGIPPEVRIVGEHLFAWTPQHLTWLGWNGFTSSAEDEVMAAWPSDAVEVLLARDIRTNQPVAWASAADGTVMPLPSSQAFRGLVALARQALGVDPVLVSEPLDQLLRATTRTQPQTLPWPDFIQLVLADPEQ